METPDFIDRLQSELQSKPVLLVAPLVLAILLLFSPVGHFQFLNWDDDYYVNKNPHVTTGLNFENVRWASTHMGLFYWHPLSYISHMLDVQLFGLRPGPHHLVNVLLHACCAVLVFLLLRRATGALWRSLFVASLFAFCPLNVETVAWIAERKSLLSAFFSLLTIAAYGRYSRNPSWQRYLLVAALFFLALASKPMAVTIPVLLLLLDYWPLCRDAKISWLRLIAEKVPLLAMSGISSALTIIGQHGAGADPDPKHMTMGIRLEEGLSSYGTYLLKLVWPARLAGYYPYTPHWHAVSELIIVTAVLVGVTLLCIRLRGQRYLMAGWLFFLVAMFPVSGVMQMGTAAVADRFLYVPALGIFVAFAWGVAEAVEKHRVAMFVPAISAIIIIGIWGFLTHQVLPQWKDSLTLFTRAAEVSPGPFWSLEEKLGDALIEVNRLDEALSHFQRACELKPKFDQCHFNIAGVYFMQGRMPEALREYQLAFRYARTKDTAMNSLLNAADAHLSIGDSAGARARLQTALRLDPKNQRAIDTLRSIGAQ